jgi:hypothetical protein
MAATYKLINSYKTTTTEAFITFTSIPATYKDLVVIYSGRSSIVDVVVYYTFNGSSGGSDYGSKNMQWNPYFGATYVNMETQNSAAFGKTFTNFSSQSSNVFGGGQIYIPGYREAFAKSPITDTGSSTSPAGSPSADAWCQMGGGLYNTGTAISSIKLAHENPTTTWIANSTFYLYGISNT